jgi:hypothetical protein
MLRKCATNFGNPGIIDSTIILYADLFILSERQLGRNAGNVKLFILPLYKLVHLCSTDSSVCNSFLKWLKG